MIMIVIVKILIDGFSQRRPSPFPRHICRLTGISELEDHSQKPSRLRVLGGLADLHVLIDARGWGVLVSSATSMDVSALGTCKP